MQVVLKIVFRGLVEWRWKLFSAQPQLSLRELRDKYKKWLAVEADAVRTLLYHSPDWLSLKHLISECTKAHQEEFAKMSNYTGRNFLSFEV
jgi:hypothetical protein